MTDLITEYRIRIEGVLDDYLIPSASIPTYLTQAMRYSTLDGGKRVRALLVYAAGHAVNAPLAKLDVVAAALECIHSYSLIHDDLPAMDDDDLRRGKATNHKQFDEATAILAGDALLTLAFNIISTDTNPLSNQQSRHITHLLSQSAGATGMVGGQMLDILATDTALNLDSLETIHRNKTGALIKASVLCGGYCADNITEQQLIALADYASHIGLAFQVVDDILDIESSTEILGKTNGADQALNKATYPALLGLSESKQLAKNLYRQAIESISTISDNTQLLTKLADLVVNRVN